jgi:hypothetical protein
VDTTNWQQMADKLKALGGNALEAAMREGTKEATDVLHAKSKELMNQDIYSIPEDRTGYSYKRDSSTAVMGYQKTGAGKRIKQRRKLSDREAGLRGVETGTKMGRKKWTRTGNLSRSEKRKVTNAFQGEVLNDAGYATARHNLGLSPGDPEIAPPPPKKKRNSSRIAPFRVRAINQTNTARLAAYRRALFAALDD